MQGRKTKEREPLGIGCYVDDLDTPVWRDRTMNPDLVRKGHEERQCSKTPTADVSKSKSKAQ